ncbi:MAG TPA: nucleotidyl transferase AbiEii/AbiGii toxin family protein [Candidatus Omnitrophota bacterium]|nr:nucleotidyl transferase AbiEii/AbiGii toxin family protein [Candidatus Omnitrophota bacterium]HPS36995.1 nucleotidyl transferase AbiEii/AbiGii toxin family protein [Candidatus Omnitrophota bacterium]
MIPFIEINNLAGKNKVPAETVEKDYVICWILKCLSASKMKDDFVFYGGTAIKRMHFEDHRYSEDIDLISAKTLGQDFLVTETVRCLKKAKEEANLSMAIDSERILSQGTRTQIFIEYSGYDEIIGAPKEVRLDLAMDMELYGDTESGKLFASYSDLKNSHETFPVMTLNTILAGKLGMLMDTTRKEPRDIFDIWFLLNRLDQFDFNLGRVKKAFKQKYGYEPSPAVLNTHLNSQTYKNRWEIRLAKQIAGLPPVETVIRDIRERLEDLLRG